MRMAVICCFSLACISGLFGQAPKEGNVKRFGIEADLENYPQKTPQGAFSSVLKALQNNKIDYLLAQLADPDYVSNRVQMVHNGKFEEMVSETRERFGNDPGIIKKLRRFSDEGTWEIQEAS